MAKQRTVFFYCLSYLHLLNYKMWNVARITFLFLVCRKRNGINSFILFFFFHFIFLAHGHLNYSAAACRIWTMCFVSFVLNVGSVSLSESVNHKTDRNNLRPRNVNCRQ